MRRGRVFFYLAAIILLGLIAAFVVFQRMSQSGSADVANMPEPTPIIDLVPVVVVTQPTPRGTVLDETILGLVDMPRDIVFEGMFSDMALVVGRQAKFDLDSGLPLTASMLVDTADQLSATGSLAALRIPRGKVAITIRVETEEDFISYAPRPGDHVAVIATMQMLDLDSEYQTALPNRVGAVEGPYINLETGESKITIRVVGDESSGVLGRTELDPILNELVYIVPSEDQRARLVSQTILHDVEVLQVGRFQLLEEELAEKDAGVQAAQQGEAPVEEPYVAEDGTEQQQPVIPMPQVITLIVNPQDAVALNYLRNAGAQLTLVLRSSGDDSVFSTEAATMQFLLDVYNIPAPAKLPYAIEPLGEMPQTEEFVNP